MTIRNAKRNNVLTFAKLFGLVISFIIILFSTGYVYYETGFDKSVPDYNKTYRCLMQGKLNGQDADFAVTSPKMAKAITTDVPEITEATRIFTVAETTVKYDDNYFSGGPLIYTDPNFFNFFGINTTTGIDEPLASNNNIMIAKSLAEKQFGPKKEALGKVFKINGEDCIVTGVFDDFPSNFHLRANLIQSLQNTNPDNVGWGSQNYYTYFKTNRPGIAMEDLNFKISKSVFTRFSDKEKGASAQNLQDLIPADEDYLLYTAEPVSDIHFSNHKFDPAITSNKVYVYGAIILALLILVISSVNFINLTMVNISTRLKQVGILKTTGAQSKHVFWQFLYEVILFWMVGFGLALLVYLLIKNSLESYLGFSISLTDGEIIRLVVAIFIALLLFNIVVNFIPIALISNKKILTLIKEEKSTSRGLTLNKVFMLLQFVLSGIIIFTSVIVQKQINYISTKDRGYNTENVIMLSSWSMEPQTRKSFIEELKTYTAIKSVSTADTYFGNDPSMNSAFFETNDMANYFHTSVMPVDASFLETFGLQMKEGRFFDDKISTDNKAIVLNETALKKYTKEESILGKNIIVDGDYKAIGVVKDFNFRSLHHQIQPLVMIQTSNSGNVFIKTQNNQINDVIKISQNLWTKYHINAPFNYDFHNKVLAQHYIKDQQAQKLLLLLSIISIAIACVGLYAISFFIIIRKTKEIGIRKINGATIKEVMLLLNKESIWTVIIAFVIATPVAYYAMNKWLENFAYKTTLSWWIFALSGLSTLVIALLTVSWQSYRAASRNPVEALRYE